MRLPRSAFLAAGGLSAAGAVTATPAASAAPLGPLALCALAVAALVACASMTAAVGRREAAIRLVAVALGAAAVLGRVLVAGSGAPPPPPAELPSGEGPWRGVVGALATPREGTHALTVVLDDGIRVRITAPLYPPIVVGDRVEVRGTLQGPPPSDFGAWLRSTGVAATLRARELIVLPVPWAPARAVEAVRSAAGDALARALPEPSAGLAAGILIGLRERVDPDLAAAFTATGLSHVVAISGWNIALVAGLVGGLLAGRPRRARAVVMLLAICIYTILAGASPSVLRAAVMAAVALVAREIGRPGSAARALGWAVLLLLVAAPASVTDAGFQLSAAATAGLLAWASPLGERIRRWAPWAPAFAVEGLAVSLAAQAATLPIVLAAFGRLALLSPLLNLVVVPLVPAAMAAGVIALAAGLLAAAGGPGVVVALAGVPGAVVLGALVQVVRIAATLPLAGLTLPDGTGPILAGATTVGLGLFLARARLRRLIAGRRHVARRAAPAARRAAGTVRAGAQSRPSGPSRGLKWLAAGLAFGLAVVVAAASTRPDGRLHVVVLDVGQGDAILIRTAHDARILVDGGPDPGRLGAVLDARLPPWDRRLDLVVLTHPHDDHAAGLAAILARYHVERVAEPGMRGSGPGYVAYAAALHSAGLRSERLAAGDRISVDGLALRVVWPDAGTVPAEPAATGSAINNTSIVLLGEADGRSFLLTGDAEEDVDPVLVARGLPHVDVLKVAHHGSRTATTDDLLAATTPAVAVVSVGVRNDYGHPAPTTLDRIRAHGAELHRTDLEGTVDVTLGRGGVAVQVDRPVGPGAMSGAGGATSGAACAINAAPDPRAMRAPESRPIGSAGDAAVGAPLAGRGTAATGRGRRRSPIIGVDVRTKPRRGRRPPPVARPAALAPPPLPSRGRGCRMARGARAASRRTRRSTPRGGRGAPS